MLPGEQTAPRTSRSFHNLRSYQACSGMVWKMSLWMHHTTMLRSILLGLITAVIALLSLHIHRVAHERGVLRADQMEISHITYGLFDPSEWKDALSGILRKKVMEFELTGSDRDQVRGRAIDLMNGLLTEVEQVLNERNRKKGVGGAMKNAVISYLVDVEDIRSGVPRYADMIVDYANDPVNRQEMQCFVMEKLDELGCRTDGKVDRTVLRRTLARYGTNDRSVALEVLTARIAAQDRALEGMYMLLTLAVATLIVLALTCSPGQRIVLIMLIIAGLSLLLAGLGTPMIDIEARIETFELILLGEHVDFTDQILFHQSKSILQVVNVLLKDGKPGLMAVAILVFAFSVVLPSLKMAFSLITLIRGRAVNGRFAHWLMNKAGKWSMADVMVVAIFMAFIGFNGVVDSQLSTLQEYASSVHVLTTNNSALEIGFYLFTAYCLIGLISSALLPKTLNTPAS